MGKPGQPPKCCRAPRATILLEMGPLLLAGPARLSVSGSNAMCCVGSGPHSLCCQAPRATILLKTTTPPCQHLRMTSRHVLGRRCGMARVSRGAPPSVAGLPGPPTRNGDPCCLPPCRHLSTNSSHVLGWRWSIAWVRRGAIRSPTSPPSLDLPGLLAESTGAAPAVDAAVTAGSLLQAASGHGRKQAQVLGLRGFRVRVCSSGSLFQTA